MHPETFWCILVSSYTTRYTILFSRPIERAIFCSLCSRRPMGFPTKVQLIDRKNSRQWYINFPSALAQAMEFSRGKLGEWFVESKNQLVLNRPQAPPSVLKKLFGTSPRRLRPCRPAARRAKNRNPDAGCFGGTGPPHRHRYAAHLRRRLPGLVGRLSPLFQSPPRRRLALCGDPPRRCQRTRSRRSGHAT